jgi:hypothetical protein
MEMQAKVGDERGRKRQKWQTGRLVYGLALIHSSPWQKPGRGRGSCPPEGCFQSSCSMELGQEAAPEALGEEVGVGGGGTQRADVEW